MPANTFSGIIDVFRLNALDLTKARDAGVAAIIHKASEGADFTDNKYAARKAAALSAGFLWGAYHLTSSAPPEQQLENFLAVEDGSNPDVLMALDWERAADGTILDIDGIRKFIRLFREKLGFYPMLYGGFTLRDTPEVVSGDPLLAKCPLWYQRYQWDPKALPVKTWPTYTLWQFADEHRGFGAPPSNVLPGADFNRFQGTEQQLREEWPFRSQEGLPAEQPLAMPRKYKVTADSLNIRKGPGIEHDIVGTLSKDQIVTGSISDDQKWLKLHNAASEPQFSSLRWLRAQVPGDLGEPPWMEVARSQIGVREVAGSGDNPRIVEYLQTVETLGSPDNENDETAWCSAFVNYCMEEIGREGTNNAMARSWLHWGNEIETPVPGCLVIFKRPPNPAHGHVAFFIEERDGEIYVLGGNQSDCVCIDGYDASRLLSYRMPA